ncbi:MAG: DUF2817 domain-containing protein [Actinomycetota bacterium]|nr:DUF2817 domain-containing protein [Actinomycetota bacterium]
MGVSSLPQTYEECRARFRRAGADAGLEVEALRLDARGPDDLELSIDAVTIGAARPERALVVLSGVHGVEGFVGSAAQIDLLGRVDPTGWPTDVGVVVVHAVNPWGMAWGRRQNEANVDLNRNWRRDENEAVPNDAYDELHSLACPDTDELPPVDELLATARAFVAERGLAWVRDAITVGQYRHRDGLHFGGDRTEQSNRLLEALIGERLSGARRVFTVDLHTGHGPCGELTALCDQPPGSDQEQFLRSIFGRVEATTANPEATTGPKSGQIANGFGAVLPAAACFATCLEVGTVDDLTQLGATYQEQWVHRRGDRDNPRHAEAVWAYRRCFTPEDPAWADTAAGGLRVALVRSLAAVIAWG